MCLPCVPFGDFNFQNSRAFLGNLIGIAIPSPGRYIQEWALDVKRGSLSGRYTFVLPCSGGRASRVMQNSTLMMLNSPVMTLNCLSFFPEVVEFCVKKDILLSATLDIGVFGEAIGHLNESFSVNIIT
jgi:hypothetical protein